MHSISSHKPTYLDCSIGQNTFKGAIKGIRCQFYNKKLEFYLFFTILKNGNHGTLLLLNIHEC
jgi:hypothetical protein